MVPGPVRIQDGPRHLLADLAVKWRSLRSTTSDIRGFRPGGDGLTHFVSSGTNHARKEPGRSRDSPVSLLHCSIRTRRIRTALATRRAQRGSPAQGWRVRTAAPLRRRGSARVPLPGVASRTGRPRISAGRRVALCAGLSAGCLLCIDQQWLAVASCREIEAVRTVRHPCSQLDLRVVLQYPQDELLERGPRFSVRPPGRMPAGVLTRNYYHFARLCGPVRAVVGVDISWCTPLSLIRGTL